MYAEITVKLRSMVTEGTLNKDAETLQTLNLDMSTSLEQFQTALHTLVSQNITGLLTDAFTKHPIDSQAVLEELQAQIAKDKKKTKEGKKDGETKAGPKGD
jgi:hypothetical protein